MAEQSLSAVSESPHSVDASNEHAEKAFTCAKCPRQFTRKENLNRHAKTHDERRSHRCPVCDRGFTRSDLLKRHEAIHNASLPSPEAASDGQPPLKRPRSNSERQSLPSTTFAMRREDGMANTHSNSPSSVHEYNPAMSYTGMAGPKEAVDLMAQNIEQVPLHFDQVTHSSTTGPLPLPSNDLNNPPVMDPFQGLTPQDPYFDFSTFTLPIDQSYPEGSDHWFSLDFYSALQETDWEQMLRFQDHPASIPFSHDQEHALQHVDALNPLSSLGHEISQSMEDGRGQDPLLMRHSHDAQRHSRVDTADTSGRMSRVSSPPNEASYEDRLPFAWDPKSQRIAEAKAIVLAPEDPLLRQHDSSFDMSEATFLKVKTFLLPNGQSFLSSMHDSFVLPALPVTNAFVGLFFKRFAPQAPVIHEPTLDVNKDLPAPLLAIMVVIGATYSRLRHTRRFAILALDRTRRHLQLLIEDDNALMRDPMIIYAAALVCYTGVWCGNKRAYEFGEMLRGAIVTYVRRWRTHFDQTPSREQPHENRAQGEAVKSQWHQWITEESRKRLFWFVYTIDCQFPCLLNLPPSMSLAEISDWNCPCDEEFWTSRSARHWKTLLGSASVPPSRAFAAAAAPFTAMSWSESSTDQGKGIGSIIFDSQFPILHLNPWSYFLVVMTVQVRIFQYSEERLLLRKVTEGANNSEEAEHSDLDGSSQHPRYLESQRSRLAAALTLWEGRYLTVPPSPHQSDPTSLYYHHASAVLCRLSRLFLNVAITDLQDAIGKSGNIGITRAMSRLSSWCRNNSAEAQHVALEAITTVDNIVRYQQRGNQSWNGLSGVSGRGSGSLQKPVDTSPYNIITLFLCHILLWTFATVTDEDQKQAVGKALRELEPISPNKPLYNITRKGLGLPENGSGSEETASESEGPDIFLKHAAKLMTRFGDWGASLNLALLLHWRSEM